MASICMYVYIYIYMIYVYTLPENSEVLSKPWLLFPAHDTKADPYIELCTRNLQVPKNLLSPTLDPKPNLLKSPKYSGDGSFQAEITHREDDCAPV